MNGLMNMHLFRDQYLSWLGFMYAKVQVLPTSS